jgi:hypothetical protein
MEDDGGVNRCVDTYASLDRGSTDDVHVFRNAPTRKPDNETLEYPCRVITARIEHICPPDLRSALPFVYMPREIS